MKEETLKALADLTEPDDIPVKERLIGNLIVGSAGILASKLASMAYKAWIAHKETN